MRGVYDCSIKIDGVTAAKTLLYLTAPATMALEVQAGSVTNASNETNEQLRTCWQLVDALGTPTATTINPAKHEDGDKGASFTVKGNVTADEPTFVADTVKGQRGWPSLSGYSYPLTPEESFTIAPGATYALRLLDAPAGSLNLVAETTVREIG